MVLPVVGWLGVARHIGVSLWPKLLSRKKRRNRTQTKGKKAAFKGAAAPFKKKGK
jgi:hypothetical protein